MADKPPNKNAKAPGAGGKIKLASILFYHKK
jgi:hypothetical protein